MERGGVEELLRRRIGLDPSTAGRGLLARALRDRMRALAIGEEERDRYVRLVEASGPEFEALVEEVVVPESWFFRDEAPFRRLGEIAEAWKADRARPPFRAVSLPCAGGEEPYSIAMALLDRGLEPERFRIDAVDVSRRCLASARAGIFSDYSFRSRDLSFRDRYFRRTEGGYELDERVRSLVRFHQGNILDPTLLAHEPPYDVVFCRNLLIYLDEPGRAQAIANLERLLGPEGTLFVGHAEPVGLLGRDFRPSGESRCFAFMRSAGPSLPPPPKPRPALVAKPAVAGPTLRQAVDRGASPANRAVTLPGRPAPQAAPAPASTPSPEARFEEATKLADQGRHAEAALLCEDEVRRHGPSARAFFLLGMIRQATGDRDGAEGLFHKVLYLDPQHQDALLALALLAARRGDAAAAANYRRRAERAAGERQAR